ncbi:MAG: hypothetical protein H8E41_01885 [Desulfobulbaceae bacterium]|uniref:Uncharacterized protein n=1 Tax=Candidatus Desulfobia pelagia TaxID=2841692 RepID=A0A8J6TB73_9BACT|nr:hypothetical protein [Candidatus Desulfobia pelagia]
MRKPTCITPEGLFQYSLHQPEYPAANLREHDAVSALGKCNNEVVDNQRNFPAESITVTGADHIYEVPNAFPFKGTTFINSRWADRNARAPQTIGLKPPASSSFSKTVATWLTDTGNTQTDLDSLFKVLPEGVLLAVATTSADPEDLVRLARLSAEFIVGDDGIPSGLVYSEGEHGPRPRISRHDLFETVANNPHLPDAYKNVMVLRPGAQGGSEIVGDWNAGDEKSHIFEYLRRNSYIGWGHYAANMANDSIRYNIDDLSKEDMTGMRHLYYQRTFVRLAEELGIPLPAEHKPLNADDLEYLRETILSVLHTGTKIKFNSTLWGWNFGFDFAPSRYRLHASHQQIHQQFAMLPRTLPVYLNGSKTDQTHEGYGAGDLVRDFAIRYRRETGQSLFDDYIRCIRNNKRMDSLNNAEESLIIHEDKNCILFVPKAQTSQWEIQLMTLGPIGNILEADQETRDSLDAAILIAQRILARLGAKMVTSIEYSKRLDNLDTDQHLIYAFLPRLPQSPGAFSEAQLRWIMGHYPEDFAAACRAQLG